MEGFDSRTAGGSLQISSGVVEKIARHAALEVEGVTEMMPAASAPKTVIGMAQKPVVVELKNDVADISVSIKVAYGAKIPELSERVQQNVKDAVQSMTSITVARVDVVVAGLAEENAGDEA